MSMAKTRRGQILVALAITGAWLISSVSGVGAADAFKMGVIDPQTVLEKSKAGKKALDGLKEYVSTRQKLLSRDEEPPPPPTSIGEVHVDMENGEEGIWPGGIARPFFFPVRPFLVLSSAP